MGIDVGHYELMSHISEFLPQKEIVVTVILDSNDVREKISGCVEGCENESNKKTGKIITMTTPRFHFIVMTSEMYYSQYDVIISK